MSGNAVAQEYPIKFVETSVMRPTRVAVAQLEVNEFDVSNAVRLWVIERYRLLGADRVEVKQDNGSWSVTVTRDV